MRNWLEDKDKYRLRYYRGIEERPTKALLFGSKIAKLLESGEANIPNLIQLPVQEYQIKIDVDQIPFFAYVDQYDPEHFKFREVKTGKNKPDGSPRWTQNDVQKHIQLDVYSLLIQLKNGEVDDECHLDWVKTREVVKTMEFDGHILSFPSNDLELTGEVESFTRIIVQEERERMRMLITSVAEEISRDYALYLKSIEVALPEFVN